MSPRTEKNVVYYGKRPSCRRAQAMLEYVLAFATLLVVVTILTTLVRVALRSADRTEDLVSAECP